MICIENILKFFCKTSWKCLEDVLKLSWRCLEDVLKTSWQNVWWWCSISPPTYTAPSDLRQLSGTMQHTTNDPLGKHYIIQSRDWLVHITNTSSEIRNSCASSIRPTGQCPTIRASNFKQVLKYKFTYCSKYYW